MPTLTQADTQAVIQYTDSEQVTGYCSDLTAPGNPYRYGYGRSIPTRYRIRYGASNRWHRVYMVCFSNSGSAYIKHKGTDLYLDIDTEYALSEGLAPNATLTEKES